MSRPSWKVVAAFISIALAHYALYLGLWGYASALGEGGLANLPRWLSISLGVLGTPLMLLPNEWFGFLHPLVGEPVYVVAGANALMWAAGLVWLFRFLATRWRVRFPAAAA